MPNYKNIISAQTHFAKPAKSFRHKKAIVLKQTDDLLTQERRRGLRYGEDKSNRALNTFAATCLLGMMFMGRKIPDEQNRLIVEALLGGGALTIIVPFAKLYYLAMKGACKMSKKLRAAGFNYNARLIAVNRYLKERGDLMFTPITRVLTKGIIARAGEKNIPKVSKKLLQLSANRPLRPEVISEFEKAGFTHDEAIKLIEDLKANNWVGSKNLNDRQLVAVAEGLKSENIELGPHAKEFKELEANPDKPVK